MSLRTSSFFPNEAWPGSENEQNPNLKGFKPLSDSEISQLIAEVLSVENYLLTNPVPQTAKLKLNNAQILAVGSVYDILPAPGVGNFYWVESAIVLANFTAAYTNIDGASELLLETHDTTMVSFEIPVSIFLAATGPQIYNVSNNGTGVGLGAQTYSDNQPLSIAFANGEAGVLTGGNAANYLTIIVRYLVIPGPT